MKAQDAQDARWLFRGAVARAIDGENFTFVANPGELPELRLESVQFAIGGSRGGEPHQKSFLPEEYFGKYVPEEDRVLPSTWESVRADIERTVAKASERLANAAWRPLPAVISLDHRAVRRLMGVFGISRTLAQSLVRNYQLATSEPLIFRDYVTDQARTPEAAAANVLFRDSSDLALVGLADAVNSASKDRTVSPRVALVKAVAKELGIEFASINPNAPLTTHAGQHTLAWKILRGVAEREQLLQDAWLVEAWKAATEFCGIVDEKIEMRSAQLGETIEADATEGFLNSVGK